MRRARIVSVALVPLFAWTTLADNRTIAENAIPGSTIIQFRGVVTSGSGFFSVGDELSGSYRLPKDSLWVNGDNNYSYWPLPEVKFELGGYSGTAPYAWSQYMHDTLLLDTMGPRDESRDVYRWATHEENGLVLQGPGRNYTGDFEMLFEDFTKTAIPPSDETGPFLVDPPNLSDFGSHQFFMRFSRGPRVVGIVTSMYVIPAPSALLLVSTGLGLVGWMRRRRAL